MAAQVPDGGGELREIAVLVQRVAGVCGQRAEQVRPEHRRDHRAEPTPARHGICLRRHCIGPVLTSISLLAFDQSTAQRGALLLFIYALGLGVPFLAMALGTGRVLESLTWFKRHHLAIDRAGGLVLMVMGIFLLLNRWTQLLSPMMEWYAKLNLHLPM